MDANRMSERELKQLKEALSHDEFNLQIVANHVYNLIQYDYPNIDTINISDEVVVVTGSRYNRGTAINKNEFLKSYQANINDPTREYSSYGRTLLRRKQYFIFLLERR